MEGQIVALHDERVYRLWLFYMAAGLSMFSEGAMVVYQLQYLRRRDAVPIVRDYQHADEFRLRAATA